MVLCGVLGPAWSPGAPRHFAWQAWHLVTFTFVSRGRCGTNSHPPSFCVAGVALMVLCGALGPAWSPGAPRHFAWQAWHLVTFTFVSRGRRGTNSHPPSFCVAGVGQMALTGWRAWTGLGACDAAALCVAGVAQPHIHLRFTWQAWHKLTSTVVLRGRRGTHGTKWRAWTGLGACDAAALCVAGVAQPHIHLRFTWQAWHLVTFTLISRAWHNCTSTVVLRGRRGTSFDTPSFTHRFVTHHLSHTIFHTQLRHPPSFTHHLSHTTLSPTIFDTPSFTHHFVTHHL